MAPTDGGFAGRRPDEPGLGRESARGSRPVTAQDRPSPGTASRASSPGREREEWWQRAVAAFPDYADYQEKTDRQIPIFLVERRS